MRKQNFYALFPSLFLVVMVITLPFVSANNTPQWFPDENTEIIYGLTHYMTLTNGTESSDTRFDVFYFNGTIFVRATHFENLTGSWSHYGKESLATNTLVRVHVTYDMENSTHLVRSKKVVWDSGESNSSVVELHVIFVERISSYMSYPHSMEDEYIPINDFPSHSDSFVDYINNSIYFGHNLGISGELHENLALISITQDALIAYGVFGTMSFVNSTYVCGLDGKISSFSVGIYHIGFPSIYSVLTASWAFTVVGPISTFGFLENLPWNWILLGTTGLELFIIVILAVKKRGK